MHMKRMKNTLSLLLALTLLAFMGAGCATQSSKPAGETSLKPVRLGIVPLPHYAHIWIAKKNGYIEEELARAGYKLDWQPFNLGPVVSEAFAAGHLDVGVMGDFPAFIGRSAGTDYQIVSIASTAPEALAVVVRMDAGISSIADLKGKKVGTTRGAYGTKLLSLLLDKNGMTMDDIRFVNLSMDDLAVALVRGDVDAGVMWDPLLTRMEDAGEISIIANGTGVYQGTAVVVAATKFITENQKAVEALKTAFARGSQFIRDNPDEAIRLLNEDLKIPPEQLKKILRKFNYDGAITDSLVAELKDTEKFLRETGLIKNPVDMEVFLRK
ncbi:aliphatic sulfonate ABC transporter substrate-binding protein [Moorella sulfitireducens (nom. illeg.)]|uniref:aliphatic sulfonate ABC transporter substrate-binding protein n=1 Tax=Neomoorella sulfitireducens TaxID=2972948 RepID=UPI0021ABC758|nr:aliphatic sulfonate ABC transporter substrate-binding protein [Moorella sulfitireducens]